MARIAQSRAPAEPVSPGQKQRYQRMLRTAARLASERDYEHVQMHEVAGAAGVAIATLYRYFPSKAHLFTAVMRWQVERFAGSASDQHRHDRATAVADLLIAMNREMLRYPQLSLAMIYANNQTQAQASAEGEQSFNDIRFQELVFNVAGIETPTEEDMRGIRLIVHCWYGVLTSALNGRISVDEAEADIRGACQLLIDWSRHAEP